MKRGIILDEIMQLCKRITAYIQEGDYGSLAREYVLRRVSELDIRRVLGSTGAV